MRWEIFHQGLEDYEYLWLLEHNLRTALDYLYPHKEFIDYVEFRTGKFVDRLVQNIFEQWGDDVYLVYHIRKILAEEIESTSERPYVLIKTNTASKSRQLEVIGLTEKDATIFINNRHIKVDNNGFFRQKVNHSKVEYIEIKAVLGSNVKLFKYSRL
jgi:hypothetical protein